MSTSKTKTAWFCKECGYESPKWLGRCPACSQWNTFIEEPVSKSGTKQGLSPTSAQDSVPLPLKDVDYSVEPRFSLNNGEMDRLLGGGMVEGSMVLLAGEPGIGKSTLSLQIPLQNPELRTLYVSGEESARQIKIRANRLGTASDQLLVLCETSLENILRHASEVKPRLLVVDSIQTMYTEDLEASPGSVSQVRECAARLLKFAKQSNTPVILIGHITKEGSIAGPKVLEHIVDVVLQFEGDSRHAYRILRGIKNRFGSTAELGIFEMTKDGLREVPNPSEILIPMHDTELSGMAVAAMMDGARPLFIETQALVSSAAYGTPQRSSTGYDIRRMNMLLAVLEKRAGFKLASKDVFLNMAGGIRVSDPSVDLAVATAVLSSTFDVAIPSKWCFCAELGLSGEVRPVSQIERRVAEAERLGFQKIFVSAYNPPVSQHGGIETVCISNIGEILKIACR